MLTRSSYNLISDGTGMTGISGGSQGNLVGTSGTPIDALLGDHGGPVQTVSLRLDSLALDTAGMKGSLYDRRPLPATWARMYGKGRVFYISLGHREVGLGQRRLPTHRLRRPLLGPRQRRRRHQEFTTY